MLPAMLRRLRSWWTRRSSLGARGERAAARHLRRKGLRIVARNLRTRIGEIDLIAEDRRDPSLLIVVEVKSGVSDGVPPEHHVNGAKRRKLTTLAAGLLRRRRLAGRRIRFDLVGVVWPEGARNPTRITHHVGAFASEI